MARVDFITPQQKLPEYYSDMPINMDRNLVTGQLARLTNDDAVKQSIVLTVLTGLGERYYQPWIGSKVKISLFNLIDDPVTLDNIKTSIKECIKNNEPRVNVENIAIAEDVDNNGYNVRIVFSTINIQETESVDIFISRVR
jgi:phage baseplate assembly protein W